MKNFFVYYDYRNIFKTSANKLKERPKDDNAYYQIITTNEELKEKKIVGFYTPGYIPEDYIYFIRKLKRILHIKSEIFNIEHIQDKNDRNTEIKDRYEYCSVVFPYSTYTYYYINDGLNIEIGDLVRVPVGNSDHSKVVQVKDIKTYNKNEVPRPVNQTKHILRVCSEEEIENYAFEFEDEY